MSRNIPYRICRTVRVADIWQLRGNTKAQGGLLLRLQKLWSRRCHKRKNPERLRAVGIIVRCLQSLTPSRKRWGVRNQVMSVCAFQTWKDTFQQKSAHDAVTASLSSIPPPSGDKLRDEKLKNAGFSAGKSGRLSAHSRIRFAGGELVVDSGRNRVLANSATSETHEEKTQRSNPTCETD